jgi:hypothetical protein
MTQSALCDAIDRGPYWGSALIYDGGAVTTVCSIGLTKSTIMFADGYLRGCFRKMQERPSAFGFEADGTYTVFLQSWDRALFDIQSLAYGRVQGAMSSVQLIPDPYFIVSGGYRTLRDFALSDRCPPWPVRSETLVWRGSVTGSGTYASVADIPRVRLAMICKDIRETDVHLIGAHPTMQNKFHPKLIEEFLADRGLVGDRLNMLQFANYKFVIDIDGHANAWGFLEKLLLGCCTLKVETSLEQWFYRDLRPWVHYVPVSSDLTDLREKFDWCLRHETECEWMARNGFDAAHRMTAEQAEFNTCISIIQASDVALAPRIKAYTDQ